MTSSKDVLRQAALVLAQLGRDARDAVLDEMPPVQAEQIRHLLLQTDTENKSEQVEAIHAFLNVNRRDVASSRDPRDPRDPLLDQRDRQLDQVEIDFESDSNAEIEHLSPASSGDSLTDLLKHEDERLAYVLRLERPSIVAGLLSAFPGPRAAGVLKHLPPQLKTQTLVTLEAGARPHPQAIEVVAEWICDHLTFQAPESSVASRHREAVQAILDEFSPDERQAMLGDLAKENPMLARRLAGPDCGPVAAAPIEEADDCYC